MSGQLPDSGLVRVTCLSSPESGPFQPVFSKNKKYFYSALKFFGEWPLTEPCQLNMSTYSRSDYTIFHSPARRIRPVGSLEVSM